MKRKPKCNQHPRHYIPCPQRAPVTLRTTRPNTSTKVTRGAATRKLTVRTYVCSAIQSRTLEWTLSFGEHFFRERSRTSPRTTVRMMGGRLRRSDRLPCRYAISPKRLPGSPDCRYGVDTSTGKDVILKVFQNVADYEKSRALRGELIRAGCVSRYALSPSLVLLIRPVESSERLKMKEGSVAVSSSSVETERSPRRCVRRRPVIASFRTPFFARYLSHEPRPSCELYHRSSERSVNSIDKASSTGVYTRTVLSSSCQISRGSSWTKAMDVLPAIQLHP